ncbi:hypothetical protein Gpo141_00012253 [Globisporangium polare]
MTETNDGAPAALCVLTNSALFFSITDFIPGTPYFVLTFAKHVAPKYTPVYSRWFRQWRGVLPFMAVKEGNARVLKALYELQRLPRYRSNVKLQFHRVVLAAVKYGRLEVLKWLHERRSIAASSDSLVALDLGLMGEAIWYRHVDVMEWLYVTCPSESSHGDAGVEHIDWNEHARTLDVVQWLHRHGYGFTAREMDQAAEHGHFNVVRFLHEHRSEGCTTRAMDAAAENGFLEIVRFLHDHRSEGCTTRAMDGAAARDHMAIVAFLHEHRAEGCTMNAMDAAAMNNHVDVVRFLGMHRSESCSSTTLLKVAMYGYADTVRAICEFSASGCLFEAKQVALAWSHSHVVAVLNEFLSDSVWSCSTAQHSQHSNGPRRCQKLNKPHKNNNSTKKKRKKRRTTSAAFADWWADSIRGFSRCYPGKDPSLLLPLSMLHAHSFRPT